MTLVTLVHPWYMFGASPMSHVQCPICLGRCVFGARGLAIKDHLFPLQVRSSHALKHLARLVGLLRGRHPKGHISALASGLVGPFSKDLPPQWLKYAGYEWSEWYSNDLEGQHGPTQC